MEVPPPGSISTVRISNFIPACIDRRTPLESFFPSVRVITKVGSILIQWGRGIMMTSVVGRRKKGLYVFLQFADIIVFDKVAF